MNIIIEPENHSNFIAQTAKRIEKLREDQNRVNESQERLWKQIEESDILVSKYLQM